MLEIERKFLIELDNDIIQNATRTIEIEQIYLNRLSPDTQRRVRKMTIDGKTTCYYTEKDRISDITKEEREVIITNEQYNTLLDERDEYLVPVIKTRRIIPWHGQKFELDSYPFCSDLATIELELSSEEQSIDFPPYIRVIKEITGMDEYRNENIAIAQRLER